MRLSRAIVAGMLLLASAGIALAESPEEIFERGNEAYMDGRFAEAAEAYDTLLRFKIRDPRVEFNLGNAYFRLGHLGLAILHFERARRLDPVDGDVLGNLAYARSFCYDKVEPPEMPVVLTWLIRLQEGIGPDRQAIAAVVLLWLGCAVVAWGLARPGRWSAAFGWSSAAIALALALVVGSWWMTWNRLDGRDVGVVLGEAVEVRAGPGAANPAVFTVHEGLTIEVRDLREDWVQVSLPNGLHGWVMREDVGIV